VYGRKDEAGIAHLVQFGTTHGNVLCDDIAAFPGFRLVFHQDGCVLEYATCLWCVVAWRP
jgi:hypothetical protein